MKLSLKRLKDLIALHPLARPSLIMAPTSHCACLYIDSNK